MWRTTFLTLAFVWSSPLEKPWFRLPPPPVPPPGVAEGFEALRYFAVTQRTAPLTTIWARPEAIPLDPWQFDVVISHQGFHLMDPAQALPEIARVLRPGGCLSASYVIRDDSVPWVRRLTALLRHYDPVAMRGNYGHDSLERLSASKYFPEVEQRAFRIWQSVSLKNLQRLVAQQPLSARLDEGQRTRLAAEVRDLYEHSVRPGEHLRLPFQLLCCRAWVSHDELTAPVVAPDHGIKIHM